MPKSKVTIKRSGVEVVMTDMVEAEIRRRTEANRDACIAQSSWGGYVSAVTKDSTRVRGRVWSYARQDGKGQTERAQRMIRNLDAQ